MKRFSEQMSLEVEKYTADYLKQLIRRDMQRGLVRDDVDVNFTAFLVNSLYIIFVTSMVSNHFKIRLREYLEIDGEFTDAALDTLIRRTTGMINSLLTPAGKE